jgi:sugar/nucleoside kinase (ribokinase family)
MDKSGIILVGNTIVDELVPVLKLGQLTYIDAGKFVPDDELKGEHPKYSVGGIAANVAVNLAKIGGGYPVSVIGKIGRDDRADLIVETLRESGIDTDFLVVDEENETSWTEVLTIERPDGSIERIFRHALGAMGAFQEDDISFEVIARHKIAMFGYGLLLPQLDLADERFGTRLGGILARTQELGVTTALDFVSPTQENMFRFLRYRKAIRYVDICCINEDQAGSLTGFEKSDEACRALVEDLGAKIAVVHCGAAGPNYAYSRGGGLLVQNNFVVPKEEFKGNAGAGDAFSAGFLHGIHQGWGLSESLRFAAAAAAISLGDVSCTGAMQEERKILEHMERVPTASG